MDVCYEHEIAYEGKECPACLIQKDRDCCDEEISRLEKELKSAEEYITKLEEKINTLENNDV